MSMSPPITDHRSGAGRPRTALADLNPQAPGILMFVTTGGRPTDGTAVVDADYWGPTCATRSGSPRRWAAGNQHGTFIEISPNPVLTYAIDDTPTDTTTTPSQP